MDAQLSAVELAGLARSLGVALPYPFTDLDTFTMEAPAGLVDEALASVLAAIAEPHVAIYAVGLDAHEDVCRVAAIETGSRGCFLLAASVTTVRLQTIDQQHLVRFLVEAVDGLGVLRAEPLFDREVTVPAHVLRAADSAAAADALRHAGLAERHVQQWLAAGSARGSGLLGAYRGADDARHVIRSVTWRLFAGGSVLAVEQPRRGRREPEVTLQPLTVRSLIRAGVDLLSSLHAADSQRAHTFVGAGS